MFAFLIVSILLLEAGNKKPGELIEDPESGFYHIPGVDFVLVGVKNGNFSIPLNISRTRILTRNHKGPFSIYEGERLINFASSTPELDKFGLPCFLSVTENLSRGRGYLIFMGSGIQIVDTAGRIFYSRARTKPGEQLTASLVWPSQGLPLVLEEPNRILGVPPKERFKRIELKDVQKKTTLWKRSVGYSAEQGRKLDADGDGIEEIYLCTYSPNNFVVYGGTSDLFRGYFDVLDIFGNLVHREVFYGPFLRVVAIPYLDRHGEWKVFVASIPIYFDDTTTLKIVDPVRWKTVLTRKYPFSLYNIWQVKQDDGNITYLAGSFDGWAYVLDDTFGVVKKNRICPVNAGWNMEQVQAFDVLDITGDGKKEYIWHVQAAVVLERNPRATIREKYQSYMVVTDSDLRVIIWRRNRAFLIPTDLNSNGIVELPVSEGDSLLYWEIGTRGPSERTVDLIE